MVALFSEMKTAVRVCCSLEASSAATGSTLQLAPPVSRGLPDCFRQQRCSVAVEFASTVYFQSLLRGGFDLFSRLESATFVLTPLEFMFTTFAPVTPTALTVSHRTFG